MATFAGVRRMRVYVSEHGRQFGITLVTVGVILILASVFAFSTPMETVTKQNNPQTIEAQHDVYVTVDNSTAAYDRGEMLQNEPLYLLSASDDAKVQSSVRAPEGTEVTATTFIRYTAVAEGNSKPFWTDERVLNEQTGTGEATFNSTVNVSAVRDRAFAVQQEFGASADVNAQIVTVIGYETGAYSGTVEVSSVIEFPSQNAYILEPNTNSVQRVTEQEVQQVDYSRTVGGTSIGIGQAIVGLLGVFGIGGGALALYMEPRLDTSAEKVTLARVRYDDFITPVKNVRCQLPDERVESLDELVQYAISTNEQVRKCGSVGVFVVEHDENTLMYDPDYEKRVRGEKPRLVQGEDGRMQLLETTEEESESGDESEGED